ncbi:MAG: hypothetical protein CVU49_01895 [Candidatus Cloacimonetes bacterium HGW-Cloacimonetes-2]|nr:MAG: hypothetical protein CVU49_01895 [Candidatus Cloacimonetes bacterium HGW-Cloacimonetes-2]
MLKLDRLSVHYPGAEEPVLKELSLELAKGEIAVLRAPSGSGKTTLLNAIAGIIGEHIKAGLEGRISLDNVDIGSFALCDRLQFLSYQMAESGFFFPNLEYELAFAPENLGIDPTAIEERISLALKRFELETLRYDDAAKLSFGQQKRLAWAICDVINAPLILLDEPSKGMSGQSLKLLKTWLLDKSNEGRIILMAEHGDALLDLPVRLIRLGDQA